MDSPQKISFVLRTKVRGQDVTPETIPFALFNEFNQQVQKLVVGSLRESSLEDAHGVIEKGSYKLVFPALPLAVLATLKPDLQLLEESHLMDGLDPKRVEVLMHWQEKSEQNEGVAYEVQPAWAQGRAIRIDSQSTYRKSPPNNLWLRSEKYLIGQVENAGGAKNANIHLRLEDTGKVMVLDSDQSYIREMAENPLYKRYKAHVIAEENLETGELRKARLVELLPFDSTYDEAGLDALIAKATPRWADVPDANAWLENLRGYGDAE